MVDMPHNLLVNTRCTDSSLLTAVIVHGDQTGEQYSSNGRTYVTKALVKIDKEIEDMLVTGIIERSEAPYASPLVLVKKPDGSYLVCVNLKDLNKITVFDPEFTIPSGITLNLISPFDVTKVVKSLDSSDMGIAQYPLQKSNVL